MLWKEQILTLLESTEYYKLFWSNNSLCVGKWIHLGHWSLPNVQNNARNLLQTQTEFVYHYWCTHEALFQLPYRQRGFPKRALKVHNWTSRRQQIVLAKDIKLFWPYIWREYKKFGPSSLQLLSTRDRPLVLTFGRNEQTQRF